MALPVIDLFAGPGGWDLAAHALGLEPIGIEWDVAACDTLRAVVPAQAALEEAA